MANAPRVLVVEDEFLIVEMLSMMLEDLGMEMCASAASADEAVTLAAAHSPDLVLMDIRLKGEKDGVDAAVTLRGARPVPVIFVTGSAEPMTLARIATHYPAPVLFKPIRADLLREAVEHALRRDGSAPGKPSE